MTPCYNKYREKIHPALWQHQLRVIKFISGILGVYRFDADESDSFFSTYRNLDTMLDEFEKLELNLTEVTNFIRHGFEVTKHTLSVKTPDVPDMIGRKYDALNENISADLEISRLWSGYQNIASRMSRLQDLAMTH